MKSMWCRVRLLALFLAVFLAFLVEPSAQIRQCYKLFTADQKLDERVKFAHKLGLDFIDISRRELGYSRKVINKKNRFYTAEGKWLRDTEITERLNLLNIPPNWSDVWVSTQPESHVQATGVDKEGRTQYIYHEKWSVVRLQIKRKKMEELGDHLPYIRKKISKDLRESHLSKEKVIASLLWLMEKTSIRIGSAIYAKQNQTFGLSTLLKSHLTLNNSKITFNFIGKSHKEHKISVVNKKISKILEDLLKLKGQNLFKYIDENNKIREISALEVNNYLKDIGSKNLSVKDFRTWKASTLAIKYILSGEELGKNYQNVYKTVAKQLRNTPAVTKSSYIDPLIIESFEDKDIIQAAIKYAKTLEFSPYSHSELIYLYLISRYR